MKTLNRILTSILHALILLPVTVLPSCTQDITDGLTRGMAEVTLVLDAGTVTKAINIDENNEFRTMRIYAYPHRNTGEDGSGDTPVGYFYDNDLSGNGPYYCTMPIELSGDSQEIDFYVLVNDGAMEPKEGQNIILKENSTRSDIESYMFSVVPGQTYREENDQTYNAIPMSNLPQKQAEGGTAIGEENRTFTIRRTSSPQYIDIEVTRAMARLRLEFAKVGRSEVKITEATLKRGPKITWLMNEPEESEQNRAYMYYNQDVMNTFLSGSGGVEITTEADPDTDPEKRKYQFVTETYMLENFYGADPGNPNDPPTDTENQNYGYRLDLTYTIDGERKEKTVYLPPVTRNQTINVSGTIEASSLEIQVQVNLWEKEESSIGWNVTATLAAWNSDTPKEPDLDDATNGDEEAALCYVVYPRYDSDHTGLEDRSSYAGFYFKLDGPKGAVWKAHLSNTEDFAFGTGKYDYESDNDKFCVSTGIARDDPYQIQIKAINPWTKGTSFDNSTDWGKEHENTEGDPDQNKQVTTKFWITVSLDGVNEYPVVINPVIKNLKTHYNTGRRFAGNNDYEITFWQLKALKEPNDFIELLEHYGYNEWWNQDSGN